jgi:hypothetical protein
LCNAQNTFQKCVHVNGKLTPVTVKYHRTGAETVLVNGKDEPFLKVYPIDSTYAEKAVWYQKQYIITVGKKNYIRYGLSRVLDMKHLIKLNLYKGVPVYALKPEGDASEMGSANTIYVFVRPGCEFQQYEPVPTTSVTSAPKYSTKEPVKLNPKTGWIDRYYIGANKDVTYPALVGSGILSKDQFERVSIIAQLEAWPPEFHNRIARGLIDEVRNYMSKFKTYKIAQWTARFYHETMQLALVWIPPNQKAAVPEDLKPTGEGFFVVVDSKELIADK